MTLAHAEVNTARMLDRMIRAARGFDLVEIEGDAAFLSRPAGARDPDTTITDILQVAVAMHRAFHIERQYVATNLCPCGGCREAGNLTLKVVAHVGEVATQTIRGADQTRRHRRDPRASPAEELGGDSGVRADLRGALKHG
ncbi:DUF2652 domain-containing protein [Microbacterium terregens]|uniref:DUF2652 domain-containing protein n=1 Tax=Microbacterium terregens TaxID=69363 RepID=UPI0031E2DBA5